MADLPPLHAVTVVWRPTDKAHPIGVHQATGCDPLEPWQQLAVLRRAAMHLAKQHDLNGQDCLRAFLANYPQLNEGTEE